MEGPPCIPERTTQRGAVPREKEDRPRPVSHGGMPEDGTMDDSGVAALSINTASKMPDTEGCAKFPKEIKPTPADVCVATCILLHAAQLAGGRVFFFTDDAKNFFN